MIDSIEDMKAKILESISHAPKPLASACPSRSQTSVVERRIDKRKNSLVDKIEEAPE